MNLGFVYLDEGMVIALMATLCLAAILSFITWRTFMRGLKKRHGVEFILTCSLFASLFVIVEPSVGYNRLKSLCLRDGGFHGNHADTIDSIHFARKFRKSLYEYAKQSGIAWVEFDEANERYRKYSTDSNNFEIAPKVTSRYSIFFHVDWSLREEWGSDISVGSVEFFDNTIDATTATLRDYRLGRDWWGKSVFPLKKISCEDAFPNDSRYDLDKYRDFLKTLTVSD